jgi:cytochrome c biogenesis protein CcmG, thiol:disulfide interchange protein DsbE
MKFTLPLALFVMLAGLLFFALRTDSTVVPSPLIGKPVPAFDLPGLREEGERFTPARLQGEDVSLLNVWASWCPPCWEEHPVLEELVAEGLAPLYGINYKDERAEALGFLERLGDPYTGIGADVDGRVGIDLGVYGVPETYVIDREGRIRYKHVGPVTRRVVEETLRPMIEDLRREAPG